MAILEGDIKLVTSRVMDDVPEGGGGPTSVEVIDGASNQLFPDIGDIDRTQGVVHIRKVHVSVQTDNTDTLINPNVIVAEPPLDPNISVTMFSTGETFDVREQAKARIEAFLSIGAQYPGFLFGNHISGQRVLLLWQRGISTPAVGASLVLTKRAGYSDQFQQYVRVTDVAAEQRTFTDSQGDFVRTVLTVKISDPLRADFAGFDALRIDPLSDVTAVRTQISNTVVANAARYYGVVPLAEAAHIGDFSFRAQSIFSQLVPSAQVETPVADARTNQQSTALVSSGNAVSITLTSAFTRTQSLFVGGSILPGSLALVRDAITLSDAAGKLLNAGTQVGLVDYENGILTLTTDVFGTSGGTHTVTYVPSVAPQAVMQSQGITVTVENRSISYVRTIQPPPERGSLIVEYRSNGNWYRLRDSGTGELRGNDSSVGSGTINFQTGTMLVTLGALPDVDSAVIYAWVPSKAARNTELLTLSNNGTLYWPINTDGAVAITAGAKSISPGGVTVTWTDGALKTATDDSNGKLTGDATGTVDYGKGVLRISPKALPPPGTTINVALNSRAAVVSSPVLTSQGSVSVGNLGFTNITPGSMEFRMTAKFSYIYKGRAERTYPKDFIMRITDDGAGKLQTWFDDKVYPMGTVNYSTGAISITNRVPIPGALAQVLVKFDTIYDYLQG